VFTCCGVPTYDAWKVVFVNPCGLSCALGSEGTFVSEWCFALGWLVGCGVERDAIGGTYSTGTDKPDEAK
jgi:hypothetical protein